MNIFYLDPVVKKCSEYHNDSHCVKMILEYCQLLSTAHRVLEGKPKKFRTDKGRIITRYVLPDKNLEKILYLSSHVNHPCGLWVRSSKENYLWLHSLTSHLVSEFKLRNKKTSHKSEPVIAALAKPPTSIPNVGFKEPPLAMPNRFKLGANAVTSYRTLYQFGKYHLASWKSPRKMPKWYATGYGDRVVNFGKVTEVTEKRYSLVDKKFKALKRFSS